MLAKAAAYNKKKQSKTRSTSAVADACAKTRISSVSARTSTFSVILQTDKQTDATENKYLLGGGNKSSYL